jgi:hypothetical protein
MSGKAKLGIALAVMAIVGIPLAGKLRKGDNRAANTYTLVTVAGHTLPYAPRYGGQQTPEIVSSTLRLNADGTFVSTMQYGKSTGNATRDSNGTYTREGANYVLSWEGAGQTSATIEENKLTMSNEGVLFVYQN